MGKKSIQSPTWIVPQYIFSNGKLDPDCALRLEDGYVKDIVNKASLGQGTEIIQLDGIVTNGAIDLQVNGGGGFLFNSSPDEEGIRAIISAHRNYGTGQILPTVISDTESVIEQAVSAVINNRDLPGLAGIHIEGPHISLKKRGTHSPEMLRPLSDHTLSQIERLSKYDIPTMITVAPEVVSPDQVNQMNQLGAIVSLGHSDAEYDQAWAAIVAGAGCFTHLFNAMSQLTSRSPGMVAAALNSQAYAGFICDGHHVSDATLSLAISVNNAKDRMFLVSDAMPTVGGPEVFKLYDMEISLDNGKLINPNGDLAGAHTTMAESMSRALNHLDLTTEEVLRMGIYLPATVIRQEKLANLCGHNLGELLSWKSDLSACQWLSEKITENSSGHNFTDH